MSRRDWLQSSLTTPTTAGDESASISASSELSFIFDAADEPEEGDTLCGAANCGSEVFFLNTDVAATVTATATNASCAAVPAVSCLGASYSVQAKVLTEIDVVLPLRQTVDANDGLATGSSARFFLLGVPGCRR